MSKKKNCKKPSPFLATMMQDQQKAAAWIASVVTTSKKQTEPSWPENMRFLPAEPEQAQSDTTRPDLINTALSNRVRQLESAGRNLLNVLFSSTAGGCSPLEYMYAVTAFDAALRGEEHPSRK